MLFGYFLLVDWNDVDGNSLEGRLVSNCKLLEEGEGGDPFSEVTSWVVLFTMLPLHTHCL